MIVEIVCLPFPGPGDTMEKIQSREDACGAIRRPTADRLKAVLN